MVASLLKLCKILVGTFIVFQNLFSVDMTEELFQSHQVEKMRLNQRIEWSLAADLKLQNVDVANQILANANARTLLQYQTVATGQF